jgi:hypothetical protein
MRDYFYLKKRGNFLSFLVQKADQFAKKCD